MRNMDSRALLDLAAEYVEARAAARDDAAFYGDVPGEPVGRTPGEVAADFDTALRDYVERHSGASTSVV